MLPRLNLLFSYAYLRKGPRTEGTTDFETVTMKVSPYSNVLIDSGAFTDYFAQRNSKNKNHKPITVEEYTRACKLYDKHVWQYIMLDVVKNSEASQRNLDYMLDAGLRPMPVFVATEDYDKVPYFVGINPHICVAGGVDGRRRFAWQRYQMTYKASDNKAKIHALGFVKYPDVFRLPLASFDSSSWCGGGRFGSINYYSPRKGFLKSQWKDLGQSTHHRLWLFLRRCGITPKDMADVRYHQKVHGIPSQTTVFAYLQLHNHCATAGSRLFLAVPNLGWLINLLSVVEFTNIKTNSFDYHNARSRHIEMNAAKKSGSFQRVMDWITTTLKEKTQWQASTELT